MLWKFRTSSLTIPAELHERIAAKSKAIEEVDSEVVAVRTLPKQVRNDREREAVSPPYFVAGA